MARTTKKRQQQLKHDKFRDSTMHAFDRLSHRYEGRGRTILYALGALAAAVVIMLVFNWWRGRQADAANLALGKAIEIHEAEISATPQPNAPGPVFPSERERAQKAIEEFRKVQGAYGSPHSEIARYFAAVNLLAVEREQGLAELQQLTGGGGDVGARARFALAQAREADGQFDQAAALYQELLNDRDRTVSENTLKLRLASVYEKQGKRDEAVNLLFPMVEAARKAQTKDGKPQTESQLVRAAADKLRYLSPERYAQLPKEEEAGGLGRP